MFHALQLMVILQVYAEPAGYWRNYYNLFDFTVLFVSVVQEILTSVRFAETELTVFRVVRGMCPRSCSSVPVPVPQSPFLFLSSRSCSSVLVPVPQSPFLFLSPRSCSSVLVPVPQSSFLFLSPRSCSSVPVPVPLDLSPFCP